MLSLLKNLSNQIRSRRKIQFLFLLIFTLCAGILEILSIASIVPFVKLVTDENFIKGTFYISRFIDIRDKQHAVIILGLIFSTLYLLNSFSRVFLIYCTARLSKMTTAELSINIYKAALYNSYSKHILKDSDSIIAAITQKVYQIGTVLSAIINIISGTFIFLCIISVLISINPQVMTISMLFFATLYFLIVLLSRKKIGESSRIINQEQNNIVKNLQNGLGAIRDIILDKTQNFYVKIFEKASFLLARKNAFVEFIQNSPRYLLEGMGIFLFVILLIYWSETKSQDEFLIIFPTLAALAIGAQRILPLLNILYTNFVIVRSNVYQINEVVNILNEYSVSEKEKTKILQKDLSFKNLITFKDVSFSYDKKKYILENVNLEITKGLKIGIIGKTGEGKSTFLDLLMGLLEPIKGNIYIDSIKLSKETNNSWQSKISHVPQKIFLSNNSFIENIAFGKEIEKIDIERVKSVSKKTQIHDFIIQSEEGYNQNVGERGIKLSGGQIQRIGLARALYKKSELIIFDEATNSLDSHTEKLVMEELNNLGQELTIIIVAHRLNTLKDCDLVFEVKDKKVTQVKID
jgi:ATP-binding cassette, subfamily B, bacterial PglK